MTQKIKKRWIPFFFFVLLVPASWLRAEPRMLFTGPLETDDPAFASKLGKDWWAACEDGSTSTLKKVTLSVKNIDPGEKQFRLQIEANGCANSLLLLKNNKWPWLVERPFSQAKILGDQPDQEIVMGTTKATLQEKEDGERFRGVYLEIDHKAHRIFGINERIWILRWAGDLDGDGKLDLLISFSDVDEEEDNAHPENKLFLSSYGDDITPVYPVVTTNQ